MLGVKVENIVASTSFAEKLDLDVIAQSLEEAEYEPEQFPGLVYRLAIPKTATLLFRSGKANIKPLKNCELTFPLMIYSLALTEPFIVIILLFFLNMLPSSLKIFS